MASEPIKIWGDEPFTGWLRLEWTSFDPSKLGDCAELYQDFEWMAGDFERGAGTWKETREFFRLRYGMRARNLGHPLTFYVQNDRVIEAAPRDSRSRQRESFRVRSHEEHGDRLCLIPGEAAPWVGSGPPRFPFRDNRGLTQGSLTEGFRWGFYTIDPRRLAGRVRGQGLQYRFTPRGVEFDVLQGCCRDDGRCEIVTLEETCPAGAAPAPLAQSKEEAAYYGVCASCKPGPPPAPPSEESSPGCCLKGRCVTMQSDLCVGLEGVPVPGGASCAPPGQPTPGCSDPPPQGGCELPDGGCVMTTRSECERTPGPYEGSYLGDGTTCPAEGACVLANRGCAITTEKACTASPGPFEGVYLGDGSDCADERACCDGPACTLASPQACAGRLLADVTSCEPENPCAPLGLGGCCDMLGLCSVATQAECREPFTFLPEGCGEGCPQRGACLNIPCPRSTETLCAETTEAECAAAGGIFELEGACDPSRQDELCPSETICDRLDGSTWFDSCSDRVSFRLERDAEGRPIHGSVRVSGRRERSGAWRCAADPTKRSTDIVWTDGTTETRDFEIVDAYRFAFVDPGPERLHWSEEPRPESRSREGAPIERISKNGELWLRFEVANCGDEPARPILRWQGEGPEETTEPPAWLRTKELQITPEVVPPSGRGVVHLTLATTEAVEPGDWVSVHVASDAGLLWTEYRFIQVRAKKLESTGLILEKQGGR